jgi:hypothetical protein
MPLKNRKVELRTLRSASSSNSSAGIIDPDGSLDGGGPLFTIFNTLLDYPQALEAVRAELERKRQKIQLPDKGH